MSDSESDGWSLPSIRRMILVAVLLFVLALVAGVAFGVFGTPSVERVENRFGGVNETATEIETNLTVSNPNPVGARFGGIRVNYTVSMNDRLMARGTKAGVELPTGNSTIMLTTVLANERIPDWWVSHLRNGERTDVRVQANVQSSTVGQSVSVTPVDREIETDILASVASDEPRPVNTEAPVGNPVLVIEESDAAWGTISEAESTIAMTFVVRNPNTYPVAITRIGYDTSMNDVAVGEGEMESGVLIPPGETRTVQATAIIENQHLDEWWVTHIERNQVSTLRIQFYATLDLSAVGAGEVRVPLRPVTTTVETDIFGNKPPAESPTGTPTTEETSTPRSSGTPTEQPPTETATPTDDDGQLTRSTPATTPTPTPTSTPIETATPTGTETDDGGGLPLP